jgi:hypothetical protein
MLGIVGCVVILSCAQNQTGSSTKKKVEIAENGILVHPTVNLSASDAEALDKVLQHFNKSLYKLEMLKGGKVAKTRGSLSDAHMDAGLKSELANAKLHGFDVWTIQFVTPGATARHWAATAASNELIEKIKPVMQKYQ